MPELNETVRSTYGRTRSPGLQRTITIHRRAVRLLTPRGSETDEGEEGEIETSEHLPDNRVITAKYTVFNFIPKNTFEQFRRIANFYFLCIAVIQSTTNSPVSPWTALFPLMFVVFTTAIKQGYEDYLRHKADKQINKRLILVLRPAPTVSNPRKWSWKEIHSQDIKVGDVIKIKDNHEFPCDVIMLSSTRSDGRCHITTANLDGETNLKVRNSIPPTVPYRTSLDLSQLEAVLECENPNADLYDFVGKVTFTRLPDVATYRSEPIESLSPRGRNAEDNKGTPSSEPTLAKRAVERKESAVSELSEKDNSEAQDLSHGSPRVTSIPLPKSDDILNVELPLSSSNLLLRGSRLKNTHAIFGIVVFTGQDTKMALNSRLTSNKFSSIEKDVNTYLIGYLTILLAITIMGTFIKIFHAKRDITMPWYLKFVNQHLLPSFLPLFFQDFLSFFVIFNYVIPISLYVTLEMVKFIGSKSLVNDPKLAEGDNKPICNSSDLNEDLGQVEYLFSDKTGTLTENEMVFRSCTIRDVKYEVREAGTELSLVKKDNPTVPIRPIPQHVIDFFIALCVCNTVQVEKIMPDDPNQSMSENKVQSTKSRGSQESTSGSRLFGALTGTRSPVPKVSGPLVHKTVPNSASAHSVSQSSSLTPSATGSQPVPPPPLLSPAAHVTSNESSKCGTLKRSLKSWSSDFEYHASSPDEKALVEAAHRLGITLVATTEAYCEISLSMPSQDQSPLSLEPKRIKLTKLHTLEFDTTRKRMSVIVKDEQGVIKMICKGAEQALQDRLVPNQVDSVTFDHIDEYATAGLRTLAVAERIIAPENYEKIKKDLHEAQVSLVDSKERIKKVYDQCERGFTLLGATAVEDYLQEGVSDTIRDLREAGIKVWVLTGDKVETAMSVAYSCALIDSSMTKLMLVRQGSEAETEETLERHMYALSDPSGVVDERTKSRRSSSKSRRTSKASLVDPDKERSSPETSDQVEINSRKGKQRKSPRKSPVRRVSKTPTTIEDVPTKFAFIVDGRSLHIALKNFKDTFSFISMSCCVVLCCRMSPIQKAEVVKLIKHSDSHPVTAAIGDGANDVSMIQEAHVGFGLMGKEGREAVNSSDFAFAKFRFVRRILLVHGHLFYSRIATMIHYFFYKNVIFMTPQVFYAFYSYYSAQSLYHSILLMFFNLLFTAAPIFVYALLEEHIPMERLDKEPALYRAVARNSNMTLPHFIKWFLNGLAHGTLAFCGTVFCVGDGGVLLPSGKQPYHYGLGLIVYHVAVLVVNLKLLIIAHSWNRIFKFTLAFSIGVLPTFLVTYTEFVSVKLYRDDLAGTYIPFIVSVSFWLVITLVTVATLMPDMICQTGYALWMSVKEVRRKRRGSSLVQAEELPPPAAIPTRPLTGPTFGPGPSSSNQVQDIFTITATNSHRVSNA